MSGVALSGVRVAYGDREVLHGVDLMVPAGELLVVLGPSGSGKSTLLRVVAGLEPVTEGTVSIGGRDVTRLRPGRRNVSMVFQSYALFPHLSVLDNIAFGLEVRDVPRRRARDLACAAARTAGCEALLDRPPGELSGGERQRVALARAVAREPDVYLLDEPLSNLDAELRERTRTELKALHERTGGTMLHVTHDQAEAMVLGDRIAVLGRGLLAQVGTPDEIWAAPASIAVARAVGAPAMNVVPATGPFAPPHAAGSEHLLVGIRPEAVLLDSKGVSATVERVDRLGSDAHVQLRLAHPAGGDDASIPLLSRVAADSRPQVGARVHVIVDTAAMHVFDAATGRRVDQ